LVEEYAFKGTHKQPLRADGTLIDELTLQHGIWEAKDTADDLEVEIEKKAPPDTRSSIPSSSRPPVPSSTRTTPPSPTSAASPSTPT
jgi:hypothetical protein